MRFPGPSPTRKRTSWSRRRQLPTVIPTRNAPGRTDLLQRPIRCRCRPPPRRPAHHPPGQSGPRVSPRLRVPAQDGARALVCTRRCPCAPSRLRVPFCRFPCTQTDHTRPLFRCWLLASALRRSLAAAPEGTGAGLPSSASAPSGHQGGSPSQDPAYGGRSSPQPVHAVSSHPGRSEFMSIREKGRIPAGSGCGPHTQERRRSGRG